MKNTHTESAPAMCLWLLVPVALIIAALTYSCECPAQEAEAKPTKPPIVVKPSPTPVPQKFITKKSVVKLGDKAEYATEKIIQNPTSVSAVKGERWVKTYRLWTRGDGVVIPLSNGWSKAADITEVVPVVEKPKVEVFK